LFMSMCMQLISRWIGLFRVAIFRFIFKPIFGSFLL
jgi:hypothetical protein